MASARPVATASTSPRKGCSAALLRRSAIVVEAGQGKEDRLMTGSDVALRRDEAMRRDEARQKLEGEAGGSSYLPDFLN